MKLLHLGIISVATSFAPMLLSAAEGKIPTAEYPKVIIGKWNIRTYVYAFNLDGTYNLENPDDGSILVKGKWNIDGSDLKLVGEDGAKQSVNIAITSKNSFVWNANKERSWDAERVETSPDTNKVEPHIASEVEVKPAPAAPAAPVAPTVSDDGTLSYDGTWIFKALTWTSVTYKFTNLGKQRIKAFRGVFEIKNDFDEVSSRVPIEYTGNTAYSSGKSSIQGHIIELGEVIYVNVTMSNGSEVVSASKKNGVVDLIQITSKSSLKESEILAQCATDPKKLSFKFGKIAKAD